MSRLCIDTPVRVPEVREQGWDKEFVALLQEAQEARVEKFLPRSDRS